MRMGVEQGGEAGLPAAESSAGVAMRGPRGWSVVFMLTREATHYYRNMTLQAERMPVLVGQVT